VEGGDSKAQRAYIVAVSGLKVEVSGYVATAARLKAWVLAEEGGLRWIHNLGLFLAYVLGSVLLAKIVRSIVKRSIGHAAATSKLLRNFIVDMSGRAIVFCGVLAGLSALEINLAQLLANTRKIVPNNTILGGVIVNHTTGVVAPAPELVKA
jgi:small conductance mechanosensitive channel